MADQSQQDVPPCPPKLKAFLKRLSDKVKSPELTAGNGIAIQNDKGKPPVISVTGVLAELPAPPAQGTWVLGASNGAFIWLPVTSC
jgi:hypothetical protein